METAGSWFLRSRSQSNCCRRSTLQSFKWTKNRSYTKKQLDKYSVYCILKCMSAAERGQKVFSCNLQICCFSVWTQTRINTDLAASQTSASLKCLERQKHPHNPHKHGYTHIHNHPHKKVCSICFSLFLEHIWTHTLSDIKQLHKNTHTQCTPYKHSRHAL